MNNPSLSPVPVTLLWNNALAPLADPVITLRDLDPESVTRRPLLAVIIPIESTLVTSSYVITPLTFKLPATEVLDPKSPWNVVALTIPELPEIVTAVPTCKEPSGP